MPRPHPPSHPALLTTSLHRQVTLVGQLVDQPHQLTRRLPGRHRVGDEPPHRGQHTVDPPRLTHRFGARTRQHLPTHHDIDATGLRSGVPQPHNEQPQRRNPVMPVPAGANAPAQEQRDATCIRPGGQLRTIPAESDMPQERIRFIHHRQVLIEHRPIPSPRRQPHQKCPHPDLLSQQAALRLPATSTTAREICCRTGPCRRSTQRHTTVQPTPENVVWCCSGPAIGRLRGGRSPRRASCYGLAGLRV